LEAGVTLVEEPLRLPRPAPSVSGEQPRGEPDTLLDDSDTRTEPDGPVAATTLGAARPLWPFGLGLLGLGALLGFVVLRGAAPTAQPEVRSSAAALSAAAPPTAVAVVPPPPATSAASSSEPPATPSSSAAAPTRAPDGKKAKPRASAAARIPTDLENPF
jgi:hypothetical protein